MQNELINEGRATFIGNVAVSRNFYPPSARGLIETTTHSIRYLFIKRAIDIGSSLLAIPVFLIPGVLIAVAILLSSKGGIFYSEGRIGSNGRPFRIWKFRSMLSAADQHSPSGPDGNEQVYWRMRKQISDPRVTALGSFLRAWSLDELPQLFNVLRGDMSLIGPRPIVRAELPLYGELLDYYLSVKPGLSGLWQVSGRSNVDYARRAELDAEYVRTWSLWGDIRLILRTIPAVLRRDGSC